MATAFDDLNQKETYEFGNAASNDGPRSYTYEELVQLGAKPVTPEANQKFSLDEAFGIFIVGIAGIFALFLLYKLSRLTAKAYRKIDRYLDQ